MLHDTMERYSQSQSLIVSGGATWNGKKTHKNKATKALTHYLSGFRSCQATKPTTAPKRRTQYKIRACYLLLVRKKVSKASLNFAGAKFDPEKIG